MTACAGKCGREATGHYDSGQPELDRQHMWCGRCQADLAAKRMPPGLVTYAPHVPPPLPSTGRELSSAGRVGTEHKIAAGEYKTVMDAPPVTDLGTFEGIANVTGIRDRQGDTTLPGSFVRTAGDLNGGRVAWALTRQHSDDPVDVVGTITEAKETTEGLWIRGTWAPGPVAQELRAKVAAGMKLSLSITYVARGQRPDGAGGRFLSDIDVTSIAITNGPASAGSFIRAGKGAAPLAGAWATVVDVYDDAQRQAERNDPERKAEDRILAAASWPPAGLFGRDMSLQLIRGAALAKSRRDLEGDPHAREVRARRERDNRYSADLAMWFAANR